MRFRKYNVGDELSSRHASAGRHVVRDPVLEVGPDGKEAYVDAFAANPGLNSIPDKAEEDAVKDDELAPIETPGVPIGDREADMIECAGSGVEDDEDSSKEGPDDDRDDGLPPDQAQRDKGGASQIGADVGVRQHPC